VGIRCVSIQTVSKIFRSRSSTSCQGGVIRGTGDIVTVAHKIITRKRIDWRRNFLQATLELHRDFVGVLERVLEPCCEESFVLIRCCALNGMNTSTDKELAFLTV